jgi:hypothetical protein
MFNLRMALLVATFSFGQVCLAAASSAELDLTKVYLDSQPVLEMTADADGQTAAQRARAIQCNLDRAILSLGQSAPRVSVGRSANGCLTLVLNNNYICDVDAASAAALNVTTEQLAGQWASRLQQALGNGLAQNSVSYETSERTLSSVLPGAQTIGGPATATRFVRLPQGMVLNAVLENTIHTSALRAGDGVVAHTTADMTLPTGEVLRSGTRIFGDVSAINTDAMFGPAPLKLSFDRMQLPDGKQFPVAASVIVGDQRLSSLVLRPGMDHTFPAGYAIKLELDAPAQVAVNGTTL